MTTTDAVQENPTLNTPSRPLVEEVLQTAENAVLTNPDSVDGMPDQSLPFPSLDRAAAGPSLVVKLAQKVAEKPFLFALLAFGGGALLAALVQSRLQRHRR